MYVQYLDVDVVTEACLHWHNFIIVFIVYVYRVMSWYIIYFSVND